MKWYVHHRWMHSRIVCKERGKEMNLSLDNSPVNSGGQARQPLGWPHPVTIPVSKNLINDNLPVPGTLPARPCKEFCWWKDGIHPAIALGDASLPCHLSLCSKSFSDWSNSNPVQVYMYVGLLTGVASLPPFRFSFIFLSQKCLLQPSLHFFFTASPKTVYFPQSSLQFWAFCWYQSSLG